MEGAKELIQRLREREARIKSLEKLILDGREELEKTREIVSKFDRYYELDRIIKSHDELLTQKDKKIEEMHSLSGQKEVSELHNRIKGFVSTSSKKGVEELLKTAPHVEMLWDAPRHEVESHDILKSLLKNPELSSEFQERIKKENELADNIHDTIEKMDSSLKELSVEREKAIHEYNTLWQSLNTLSQKEEIMRKRPSALSKILSHTEMLVGKDLENQMEDYALVINKLNQQKDEGKLENVHEKSIEGLYSTYFRTRERYEKLTGNKAPIHKIPQRKRKGK